MKRANKSAGHPAITVTKLSPASKSMRKLPAGVIRVDYVSGADGMKDWALLEKPRKRNIWIVFVHGYGSKGDQLYKLRERWDPHFRKAGLGMLSLNLRGSVFMAPPAADDMHALLNWVRRTHKAKKFILFSGSMGGTSNLIYATLYPRDCAAVAALGASTDMAEHYRWQMTHKRGTIQRKIGEAIAKVYGGTPEQRPAIYRKLSPLFHTKRFTMPVFLSHGEKDALIPVEEMRAIARKLAGRRNVVYFEIPGGDHDSPCFHPAAMKWLVKQVKRRRG